MTGDDLIRAERARMLEDAERTVSAFLKNPMTVSVEAFEHARKVIRAHYILTAVAGGASAERAVAAGEQGAA